MGRQRHRSRLSAARCLRPDYLSILPLLLCWHTASLAMSKAFTHRGRQTRHRVTAVTPGPEPAGEWPHPLDSAPSEEERHTGARRLVGSRAIEDDLPLARDLVVPILQLLERQVQRARNDG